MWVCGPICEGGGGATVASVFRSDNNGRFPKHKYHSVYKPFSPYPHVYFLFPPPPTKHFRILRYVGYNILVVNRIDKKFIVGVSFKGIISLQNTSADRNQVRVHSAIHPYRFTKDMFDNMVVINQLDQKFIVCVLTREAAGKTIYELQGTNGCHFLSEFNPFSLLYNQMYSYMFSVIVRVWIVFRSPLDSEDDDHSGS